MNPVVTADVMKNDVLTVNMETTVIDAARMMLMHRISGLPVIDWNRHLVGIVTEGDLLRRSEIGTERHRSRWLDLLLGPGRAAEDYTMAHARKVSEVMTDRPVTVTADTPLSEVVALMEQHRIKRVPVLDGDRLIGIVSRADLLCALVNATRNTHTIPVSDDRIRELVLSEIDRQEWSSCATINIAVKNGTVELRGCITDEREREALKVLAENVPGVTQVIDQLVWVEPLSGMVLEPRDLEEAAAATP